MNIRAIIHDLYQQEKPPRSEAEFWANGACLAFPGKVLLATTGRDPLADTRAQFKTMDEALRLMAAKGVKTVADYFQDIYPQIPVAQAKAGDLCAAANPDGTDGLGIVMGAQIVVSTPRGLGVLPLLRATRVWRPVK